MVISVPATEMETEEEFLSIHHLKKLIKIKKELQQLSQDITETILVNSADFFKELQIEVKQVQELRASFTHQD